MQVDVDDMPEITALVENPWRKLSAMGEEKAARTVEDRELEDDDDNDTEFSFEFSSCLTLDLPSPQRMLSAEELFFDGKLRLSQSKELESRAESEEFYHEGKAHLPILNVETSDTERRNSDVWKEPNRMKESDAEFHVPAAADLPMVRTSVHDSLAMAKQHLRSLHESPRCLSMTIEGSRGHPRRSCISLNSSRCSSPTRLRTSGGTFSQPPTTPTSPKASSSQKASKFLHFFKLKKHLTNGSKDALLISSENPATSTGSSRLSRTFWPFSRSNSAGESKSSHRILPLPRRSNSAGESKTTSSSLLSNNALNKRSGKDGMQRISDDLTGSLLVSTRKGQAIQCLGHQQADKKGLTPLPVSNMKRNSSCFVLSNCGADSVALSGARPPLAPSPYRSPATSHACAEVAHVTTQSDEVNLLVSALPKSESACISKEFNSNLDSPGRHVRHGSATNIPAHNINRGSPARQWSNSRMGSSARSVQQRFGPPPRGLAVRPKDALGRDSVSIRVTPVLNVPACITPSPKSKLFNNLGNLFSKRERVSGGYTMLVTTDSQSGG